jgi:hypothetical protein
MFSFDRTGVDVACYKYFSEAKKVLEPYGLEAVHGSYSSIAALGHLGCVGMNFGCAMYDYHSRDAFANLSQLEGMVRAFIQFYTDNKEVYLPYTQLPAPTFTRETVGAYGQSEFYTHEDLDEAYWRRNLYPGYTGTAAYQARAKERAKEDETKALLIYNSFLAGDGKYFAGLTPFEWWMSHNKGRTFVQHHYKCGDCKCWFTFDDTYRLKKDYECLCLSCFMEYAEEEGYLPITWFQVSYDSRDARYNGDSDSGNRRKRSEGGGGGGGDASPLIPPAEWTDCPY